MICFLADIQNFKETPDSGYFHPLATSPHTANTARTTSSVTSLLHFLPSGW
jgi:hypothetical protein